MYMGYQWRKTAEHALHMPHLAPAVDGVEAAGGLAVDRQEDGVRRDAVAVHLLDNSSIVRAVPQVSMRYTLRRSPST